jgi:hypothetical protein
MEVYLHCEGIKDYAVIYPLMKQLSGDSELSLQWIRRDVLKKWVTHRKSGYSLTGSYKMITALAAIALKNGNENIAYHQDADGQFSDVYTAIISHFIALKSTGFNCLAIVPKEMIEAWIMADKDAFPKAPEHPPLPSNPEKLWGNPDSKNHPKQYIEKVLEQFQLTPCSEVFADIAENTGIETLKSRCPESFGQFYADMQIFIANGAETAS